ncbi:hypothetical protein [Sulfobacillus thermosulfidooxidans]|uniref:hypothetical protein n=1 Tax=Sulfobacillus thermosulfidooxidans TaxID=28034 RepID=UPI000C716B2F|nr:hypothetical protein [Sulfobacillus thermosulfidooxidans]
MQDKESLALAVCALVREHLRISSSKGLPGSRKRIPVDNTPGHWEGFTGDNTPAGHLVGPSLPSFSVVSVSAVGEAIWIAFRQPSADPTRTFVWVMDLPPMKSLSADVAEAIITENFLEEMAFAGTRNWVDRPWLETGSLTFLGNLQQ